MISIRFFLYLNDRQHQWHTNFMCERIDGISDHVGSHEYQQHYISKYELREKNILLISGSDII